MKKKWFYALAGTFMIFTSCQENENSMMETSMQGDGAQLKYDSTLELVEAFRDHVNQNEPKTKTLEEELVPISVEKKVLTVKMPEDANLSRTLGIQNQEEGTTEVVLETIKFQKDGTYGFAIATNDPRLNSVYAYTEDGQLSDTIFNIGLAETLSKIPLIVEKEIENYYTAEENGNETTRALNGEVIGPLVKTAWNQTAPYNDKLGTCSNGEHVVAGCVTVAVAQTIAYYDYPVSYSSTYNLSTLRNQKYIYTGSAYASTVANFFRTVGFGCKINFGCDASGGTIQNAQSYMESIGFYNLSRADDENVDMNQLYRNLKRGNVHITSGFTKKPTRVGHAWIWDGISAKTDGTNVNTVYSLHCNWGWGGSSDGWYASYETPDNGVGTFLDDNVQLYIAMY